MELELTPEQPPEIEQAVAVALDIAAAPAEPDPWWRAGNQDALDT